MAPLLFLLATQLVLTLNLNPYNLKNYENINDTTSDPQINISSKVSIRENYRQIEKSAVVENSFQNNETNDNFKSSLTNATKTTPTPKIKHREILSVERSINSSTINNLTKLFRSKYKNENIQTKDLNSSLTQTTLNPHYYENIATYSSFNHHFKTFAPPKKSLNFTNLIENSSSDVNNKAKLSKAINSTSVTSNPRLNKIGSEEPDPFQGNHLNFSNANYVKNDNGSESVVQNKSNTNYFKLAVTKLLNILKLGNERPQRSEVASTTPSYHCCAINATGLSKTEDAYRQQNRSIFLKLIGNGLRLKPAVIKRAHSLTSNQSSLSVEDVLNDAPELFNIGLKRLQETKNSHGMLYHEKESSDSYPNPTKDIYKTNNEMHEETSIATVEDFIANRKERTSFTRRAARIKSDSINLNGISTTTEYYQAQEENPTKAQLSKPFTAGNNLSTNCLNCNRTYNDTLNKSAMDGFHGSEKVLRNNFYTANILNNNLSYPTLSSDLTTADGISPRSSVLSTSENESEFEKFKARGVANNFTDKVLGIYNGILITTSASDKIASAINLGDNSSSDSNRSSGGSLKVISEFPWPVKKEAVVEGDLVLGGLMMVHEREDTVTCGPVMPQGGIQALEAMLYTLDRLNEAPTAILPNITLGAHILDDCDKDTYGLEMAVDFIKGKAVFLVYLLNF